jgi:hypothetical protein
VYSSSAQPESSSDCPAICCRVTGFDVPSLPADVDAEVVVAAPPEVPVPVSPEDESMVDLLSMDVFMGDAPAP